MNIDFENLKVSGIRLYYYFICKRKLWLFDKNICMETGNDRVLQGSVVHEESYKKEKSKELLIDNLIKVDIMDRNYVKEVKISSKMKNADRMQLLYYLYYLKRLGINRRGTLNYVKEKIVEEVELNEEDERLIEKSLQDINVFLKEKYPPKPHKLPYCKNCSYYEYCYVEEDE